MIYNQRRPFTLMPLVALSALSLALTVSVWSAGTIRAASPLRYATVTVRPGDNVWSLATQRAITGSDIQGVVDEIIAVNHIGAAGVTPGQRIRIPL